MPHSCIPATETLRNGALAPKPTLGPAALAPPARNPPFNPAGAAASPDTCAGLGRDREGETRCHWRSEMAMLPKLQLLTLVAQR